MITTTEIVDDPAWYYQNNLHGLVHPFEKDEPHPPRKAVLGKWRIVNGLCIIDQLIERVLFRPFVDQLKSLYPCSAAVVGVGFSDDHSSLLSSEIVDSFTMSRTYAMDVSGWERSLGRNLLIAASELLIARIRNPQNYKCVIHCIRLHIRMLTNPLLIVPSSDRTSYELVARSNPSGMLSGSYMTTTYNTLSRVLIAYDCGALSVKAAGDDSIEELPCSIEEYRRRYEEVGFTLREVELLDNNNIKFCSHHFRRVGTESWVASLESWPKALHSVLSKKITPELRSAFLYEVRHNPNKVALATALEEYGEFVLPQTGVSGKEIELNNGKEQEQTKEN